MRKKGFFGEAGGWVLGLLLVFIIISILVSPKKLYAQAKDAVFNFGSNFLPKEKFPQSLGENRFPSELEQYYKSLFSKIKNSGSGNNCWIKIDKMPKMDGFGITLYKDGIDIQKISSRGLSIPEKSEPIEGFNPCSIKGANAKKFYECAIKKAKCPDAYEEDKSIIINEKTNIAEFLFKFDNSHLCVIYLDGNDLNIEKIQKAYPDCSTTQSNKLASGNSLTSEEPRATYNIVSNTAIIYWKKLTSKDTEYAVSRSDGDNPTIQVCIDIKADTKKEEYYCVDDNYFIPGTRYIYNIYTYAGSAELSKRTVDVNTPAT